MRVVLLGLTGMGNAALRALRSASVDVAAVITDKVRGPGFPHYPCGELVDLCRHMEIPVWTGVDLSAAAGMHRIMKISPDALVVATSPKMVPDELVERLAGRVVSCHPSLLPLHRGPTPIAWSIDCDERSTGLTFIQPTAELDAGPIWDQYTTAIGSDETQGELRYRLEQVMVAQFFPTVVEGVITGRLQPRPQEGTPTQEGRASQSLADVDWSHDSADRCLRRFRARTPHPGAYVMCDNRPRRLLRLRQIADAPTRAPGTVEINNLGCVIVHVQDGRLLGDVSSDPHAAS